MLSALARLFRRTPLPSIDHEGLAQALRTHSHTLIDVREATEYRAGHIPGAHNHPLSSFDPAKLPKQKPVILVCQAGGRSASALRKALAAGHTAIMHYPAGTGGWKARGGKIVL